MELALTELKLVSVFTARTLQIREAWDEWDEKRYAFLSLNFGFQLANTAP
jgi:hypothetical protein